MDSLITAAARALVVGDALGALKRVSLRNDPPALAVRRLLLLGRLDEAASALASVGAGPLPSRLTAPLGGSERSERGGGFLGVRGLPPALVAVAELAAAEVALRSVRAAPARAALAR